MLRKEQARHLRNHSTTPEVLLWNRLKRDQIGFQFRRQHCLGPYILDFYCPSLRLYIEVDGQVHDLKTQSDNKRDAFLTEQGVTVMRISAASILRNSSSVAEQIKEVCERMSRGEEPFDDV
ncbi:MAG: endonuclease domain-containing protein [Armatimonadetes bacterium]|nr:endonuclease domain-containing protein [Armatimonadota bacterium]